MGKRANVTSVDALKDFRAKLMVYAAKARPLVEEAGSDVRATRMWLENDQRLHWQNEVRRRAKVLNEAQQELFSARMSNLREATTTHQIAVRKAQRALEEAEDKLRLLKQRARDFENQVEPLLRQLGGLQTLLLNEMPNATAYLAQAIDTLEAYAQTGPVAAEAAMPSAGAGPNESAEKQEPPIAAGPNSNDLQKPAGTSETAAQTVKDAADSEAAKMEETK